MFQKFLGGIGLGSQRPQDLFERHWKGIQSIYNSDRTYTVGPQSQDGDQDNEDSKECRQCLDGITKLLLNEYKEHRANASRTTTTNTNNNTNNPDSNNNTLYSHELGNFNGPCFDLLISKDVIPLLTAAAQTDRPPGMSVHTLKVLKEFIDYFGDALLPQESVHKNLNMLVKVMTRIVNDSQLSSHSHRRDMPQLRFALLDFITTTIHKIHQHNELGNFFFFHNTTTDVPEFELFHSLTQFYFDGTEDEQDMASVAILECIHLNSKDLSTYLADKTNFVENMCRLLCATYISASKEQQAMRQEPRQSQTQSDKERPPNNQIQLLALPLSNLMSKEIAFYDACVQRAMEPLHSKMCEQFRQNFLEIALCREMFELEELVTIGATNNVRELLYLSSPSLLTAVIDTILRETPIGGQNASLLQLLINRINVASVNISVATLSFFEVLIALNRPDVLDSLIGCYLQQGLFQIPEIPPKPDWAVVTTNQLFEYFMSGDSSYNLSEPATYPRYFERYLVDAESNISTVVDTYGDDSILEASVVSPSANDVVCRAIVAHANGTPKTANNPLGPFLTAIFQRVEKMLDQPFPINIAVSGVLSRIAVQIDPLMHTLIFNPHVTLQHGARSLPIILREVLEEAQTECAGMDHREERLEKARSNLREYFGRTSSTTQGNNNNNGSAGNSSNKSQQRGMGMMDPEQVVRGAVVAQEVAKELCAVLAAKGVMRELYSNLEALYAE